MAVIAMSKEIKVSDQNYGNRTSKIEINVDSTNMVTATRLLEDWAALMKDGVEYAIASDEETLTVREAREAQRHRQAVEEVVLAIAAITV